LPAWAIIEQQPRVMVRNANGNETPDPRVFPFDAKSMGAAFTRTARFLGIEDWHSTTYGAK